MADYKLIGAILLLQKRKKTLIIITLISIIATMTYITFFYDHYSASFTMTISKSENLLNNNTTKTYQAYTQENAEFSENMLDSEAINYIEKLKISKSANARINPYKDNVFLHQEDFSRYIIDEGFYKYLKSKGIDSQKVKVSCIADTLSVTTSSNNNNESTVLLEQMQEVIPEYIELKIKEKINELKGYHSEWLDKDKAKIKDLIAQYNALKANTQNNFDSLESQRATLNEYASVVIDYDISCSVVRLSDDYLNMNLKPKTYVHAIKHTTDKSSLLIVYFIISALFGIALSSVIIFVLEFFKEFKKQSPNMAR